MARIAVTTGIVMLLGGVIGWISPAEVSHPLPTGRAYDVAVQDNTAVFDLPLADAGERYLIVVANLSREVPAKRVSLSSERVDEIEHVPLSEVRPLATKSLDPVVPGSLGPFAQPSQAPSSRGFWLHLGEGAYDNPAAYRNVESQLAGEGPHVRVYVDVDDEVEPEVVRTIIALYEHEVRPTIAAHLGTPADVDGDGKLSILMTSRLSRLSSGGLGGMVWSEDFHPDGTPPISNRADVVYLNAAVRVGPHAATLLAHELAHAVTASGRMACDSLLFGEHAEESWLNEAISHVAENLHSDNWSNLDHRIAAFLSGEHSTPLVVPRYSQHGLWRSPAARGCTYLFLRWCVDRYGPGLLSRLIHSPRRGVKNLEAATGASFDDLFRQWALDLYLKPGDVGHSGPPVASAAVVPRPDVHGTVGRHVLAGPRCDDWDVGSSLLEVELAGTSFRHIVLSAKRPGTYRIRVNAEPSARLQLTLMRLAK